MKKIFVILIGIALLTATILTGSYGLSERNIEIYRQAAELEKSADFGFEGFMLTDYPVAFYDGDNDYVLTYENDEIKTEKRKPVLNAIAATAYLVDEHYEVLAPTVEKMESLIGMLSTGKTAYGTEEQVATIWHEAFHCYQLTNYADNIEGIVIEAVNEGLISEYADSSNEAVRIFTEQAELLQAAVNTNDFDKIREYIVKYKRLDTERKALLPENVINLEEYYTRVEGSACYIEANVYKMLKSTDFQQNYIDTISVYNNGSGKYYKTGMAMCMILDRLNPDWKNGYDFSVSFTEIIYNELEL